MKFDLTNKTHVSKCLAKLNFFIENEYFIELKRILPKRTGQQNRYLHLILTGFAIEYGETLEYVKTEFYKKKCNPDIFIFERTNPKTGEIRKALRSSADLDAKEMNISIERFRNMSAKIGIYLPEPNEEAFLRQIEIDMENYKQHL